MFKNTIIYIDEFVGFTPQEYKVISKILQVAKQVNVTVCTNSLIESKNKESDIFYTNKKTVSKIISLDKEKGQVVVENVNVVKRHTRPNQTNPDGGIVEKNMPFSISNVMYHCSNCKTGVRLGVKFLENGKKVRYCKKCNEVIDKA